MKKVCFLALLVVVLMSGCGKKEISSEYSARKPGQGSVLGPEEEINRLKAQQQRRQQQLREQELQRQKREQTFGSAQQINGQAREKQAVQQIENQRIFFHFDSFELSEEGRAILQHVAKVMREFRNLKLRVEGYCDDRGTAEYNMALGERRARTVVDFLVVLGIDSSRLQVLSFGEENPLDTAQTESAWAMNRRAEFYFLK